MAPPSLIGADAAARLPEALGELGIAGGAVYDAIVGLAAVEHDASLATRDVRAEATYEIVGASVVVAGRANVAWGRGMPPRHRLS